MARLSILLLLAALFYLHTSEACKFGERCHGVYLKARSDRSRSPLSNQQSRKPQKARSYPSSPSSRNQQSQQPPKNPPSSPSSSNQQHRRQPQKDYDKLALVYHWAPSYCRKMNSNCYISKTAQKTWTIHGLWPFKSNVKSINGPVDCRGTYDKSKMSSVRSKMNEKWPNYNRKRTNDDFWQCEYEKHGTCADDIPQLDSQEKYFSGTMDLYDKYNIKDILAKGDHAVTPSDHDTYPLDYITSALKKGLGVEPAVYCVEKKTGLYLWEVRMCFDKTLSPITCGDDLVGGGRCNSNKNVTYEPFDSYMTEKSLPAFDDLDALRFLLNVAEMGEREVMRDEAEEGEKEDLWENSFGDNDEFCEEDD